MSWQAGSYGILALVLIGGFAWYERSRPASQTVALVAAMAALAVAGRVAFPVLPNVVATTDIVLFAGYAIGAAPGFVVGALAGLVSNFWLGQGPWTPWQMAGWGMVGIAGAGLATLSGRRLGRVSLAAACGVAGLVYGALLDFSLMVTYGGEQSLDRFLALSARGVPFNVAHATGNIVIALVAGPALVRMLVRFRERFEVDWSPQPAALLLAAGVSLALAIPAGEGEAAAGGSASAVSWLRGVQNEDGGFGADPAAESDPSMTGWVSLGLEAVGVNPLDVTSGGPGTAKSPISYLRANAGDVRSAGDIERTILVLRGAGLGARAFGGRDLVADLRKVRGDGTYGGQVNLAAFGVLSLDAAGSNGGNAATADWLASAQNGDGGWGFSLHTASDADSTGAAIQALAAAGGHGGDIAEAVGFLRANQRPGGGFPLSRGAVNSQSTAWAVQGLVAAGENPASVRRSGDPLGYLGARQAADGHYRYSAGSDQTPVWVTGQVLLAVERQAFPIGVVARAPVSKTAGGGGPSAIATASAPGSSGGGRTKKQGKKGGAAGQAAPQAPVVADPAVEAPVAATDEPVDAGSGDDGGPNAAVLAAGGLGAAVLLATGGWFLYRRRLPG